MAEVQVPPQFPFLATERLAAARERRLPVYAKDALDRARALISTIKGVQIPQDTSNNEVPALPPITDLNGEPLPDHVPTPELESKDDAQYRDAQEEFESIERWFKDLPTPTLAHKVEYATAKRKWEIQREISKQRKHLQDLEDAEQRNAQVLQDEQNAQAQEPEADNEIFVPQEQSLEDRLMLLRDHNEGNGQGTNQDQQTMTPVPPPAPLPMFPVIKRRRPNRLSAAEYRKSMEVGFEPILEKLRGGRKRKAVADPINPAHPARKAGPPAKKRKTKSKAVAVSTPMNVSSNVIEEAHASASMPALTGITATKRQDVLAEIIASIPTKDQEVAEADAELLNDALKKFTHRLKKAKRSDDKVDDDDCKWMMKGLKQGLYNYQVIGCGFMRDRENSPLEPKGGLYCDEMGFGKTIAALANILDGPPSDPYDPVRTTLLVVPSVLTKHWMDEIRKHCDGTAIGRVVNYHARAKLETLNDVEDLNSYSVVITTYEEVRRSYPKFKPALELANEAMLREQWAEIFKDNRGPLHHIKFHRIVLDEAHTIKNRKSDVSIAVRGLTGRHKWLVSGTPITNSNDEWYPPFAFLNVPGIATYQDFVSFFRNETLGDERLSNMLRAYMCRRTHSSRLFTRPILALPDVKETRLIAEFCEAEWIIYEAIVQMFLESINEMGGTRRDKEAQSNCILSMILRLRMFCNHPLTVQRILKYLLRPEGTLMGQLSNISRKVVARNGVTDSTSSEIVTMLVAAKTDYDNLVKKRHDDRLNVMEDSDSSIFREDPNLLERFKKLAEEYNKDRKWVELSDMTMCPNCKEVPKEAALTSCLHGYCQGCYVTLYRAAESAMNEDPSSEDTQEPKPICHRCTSPVDFAIRLPNSEQEKAVSASEPVPEPENPTTLAAQTQERRELTSRKGRAKKNSNTEDDNREEHEDWIRACGARMPSAKLARIKSIIQRWKRGNKSTKVVIFTQFKNFIRILAEMCEEEHWGYRCLYGDMTIPARHQSLEDFHNSPDITILIVSLATGGTGLDMTPANKCVLVDLWWNEAIQNQAFCRLIRHGQLKKVECVKMVVKGSIDEYMMDLQTRKTEEITSTMGDQVLLKRDTVIELLKLFAEVEEDPSGRLTAKPKLGQRRGKIKEVLAQGKAVHKTAK
ncbi:SNF2 family N-terminal domain-containing protein [Aspergillus multicolor]|uniref:putative SNF2 family helicase n=1 Tax=Aspergillus multicolor TaxID=41759 RepID=UPI003CCCD9C1